MVCCSGQRQVPEERIRDRLKTNKFELEFFLLTKTELSMKKLFISLAVIAILCMIWWTVQAQSQKTDSSRQIWEYKTLQLYGAGGDWQSWSEDGKELSLPISPTAKRTELGNAGWELVSVATYVNSSLASTASVWGYSTYTSSIVQFFKRPK